MNMINVAIPHDLTLSVQQGLLVLLYYSTKTLSLGLRTQVCEA